MAESVGKELHLTFVDKDDEDKDDLALDNMQEFVSFL